MKKIEKRENKQPKHIFETDCLSKGNKSS